MPFNLWPYFSIFLFKTHHSDLEVTAGGLVQLRTQTKQAKEDKDQMPRARLVCVKSRSLLVMASDCHHRDPVSFNNAAAVAFKFLRRDVTVYSLAGKPKFQLKATEIPTNSTKNRVVLAKTF
eukprot:g50801.t1